MKNKLFMVALATLALASCASDEVVSVQSNDSEAIRFRSSVTTSRGSEVSETTLAATEANGGGFWVKAFNAETDAAEWTKAPKDGMYKFVKQSDNSYQATNATSQDDLRWPVDHNLDFFASNLDPDNYTMVNPVGGTQPQYTGFAPKTTIKDQLDFVYATNKGWRADFTSSIPLDFKHAL